MCQNGRLRCESSTRPVAEVCNGTDDDCDGRTDRLVPAHATLANLVSVVLVQLDEADDIHAQQSARPTPEDAMASTMMARLMSTTKVKPAERASGVCVADRRHVQTGGSYVLPRQPSSENCNGTDDDCDGRIDEKIRPVMRYRSFRVLGRHDSRESGQISAIHQNSIPRILRPA